MDCYWVGAVPDLKGLYASLGLGDYELGALPHPLIVSIKDNGNYIRVLSYSYYTTITGWEVPPEGYHC